MSQSRAPTKNELHSRMTRQSYVIERLERDLRAARARIFDLEMELQRRVLDEQQRATKRTG